MQSSSAIFIAFVIPLLVVGLFVGLTTPLACLVVITLLLFLTDKHTTGFFLLLFGGVIGGLFRSLYPSVPLYGLFLNLIGLFLIRDRLIPILKERKESLFFLFIVFAIFFSTYMYAVHTGESNQKIFYIIYNGVIYFIAYYTLDSSRTFSHERLALLLILVSLLLFSFAEVKYHLYPSSILDFNWVRAGLNYQLYVTQENLLIDYQEIGMDLTYAMAFILGGKKMPKNWLLYLAIGSYLILMSGARQALLGFVVIFFIRVTLLSSNKSFKRILIYIVSIFLLFAFYLLLQNLDISIVNSTLEEGDSERFLIWTMALNLFLDNPVWGAGIGGFHLYAVDYPWPHNFFLEILCECGLYGAIALFIVTSLYIYRNKVSMKYMTSNNLYYFIFILAFFVRVMVSSDLTQSIGLFAAIFAISGRQMRIKRLPL